MTPDGKVSVIHAVLPAPAPGRGQWWRREGKQNPPPWRYTRRGSQVCGVMIRRQHLSEVIIYRMTARCTATQMRHNAHSRPIVPDRA